jgi:hypothetical protein
MTVSIDDVREQFAKHLFERARKKKSFDSAFMHAIKYVYANVWEEAWQAGYNKAKKDFGITPENPRDFLSLHD